jgi:xanthine dehydrogenase accessory factor
MLQSDSILERAAELKIQGVPFVLATVVRCESPTSAKPGAKAVVEADGAISGWIGGGCAQPAVIATAKKALEDGQARLIRVSPTKGGEVEEGVIDFGMTCHSGGTLDIFLEPYTARPSLLIIGSSPAARALNGLAQRTGFDVFAAFPGADTNQFPDARQVLDRLEVAELSCGRPDFVVVATQGKRDEPGLEAALATGAGYVAFIASARKAEKLRIYLKERGHDAARVDAIVSPAGVDIGAVTPEEIALSVLGAVVKARRTRTVADSAPAGVAAKAVQFPPIETSAGAGSAIDPVCGMNVDIATAAFRSDYRGRSFFFCCGGCQHSFEKAPEQYLPGTEAPA